MDVTFRNDDVNTLTPELQRFTDLLLEQNLPITHTVEPGNMTKETIGWLRRLKSSHPKLIEIVQHGWKHIRYGAGEFSDERSYEEQYHDLSEGKKRMEEAFGTDFFPMLTFPFGCYNEDTLKAADRLGYKVISSNFNCRISRQVFYLIGRLLHRSRIYGRTVSYHLKYRPGTNLFEIDSSISFISKYFDDFGDDCEMLSANEIMERFQSARKFSSVIGFLFHHRYHRKQHHIQLIDDVTQSLKSLTDVQFVTFEETYKKRRGS